MKQISVLNQFFRIKGDEGIKFCTRCKTDYKLNVLSVSYINVSSTKKIPYNWNTLKVKHIGKNELKNITPIINTQLGSPYIPVATACNLLNTVVPDSMDDDIHSSLNRLKESVSDVTEFVCERLQFTREQICKSLAAEQIDAVALAIYNIESKEQGFIIGDQTGIGKGRMAAAIIRYAIKRGLQPIFITEKPNLFSDMYRDLAAIDSGDYKPFIVNSKSSDSKVKDSNGNIVYDADDKNIQENILKKSSIPKEYHYIMATYSQFRSEKPTVKQEFLRQVSQNNILILDESHNAGGNPDVSNTAKFFIEMLKQAKGVCFLSATFAKRPDNMPLYAQKTCIGESNMSNENLIEAIKKGGIALQEVLSSNIVREGQMIRRERSFENVEVNYITLDRTGANQFRVEDKEKEHRAVLDNITQLMREIIKFEEDHISNVIDKKDDAAAAEGSEAEKTKGSKNIGVDNTPYFSKVFNIMNQVLFSIKAEDVAKRAIQRLQEGKKVVLAFSSTMGAMLESSTNDRGILVADGDIVVADYSISLLAGLNSTLKYTITDQAGKKEKLLLSIDEDLTEEGRIEYRRIKSKIQSVATGITISPIDVMKHDIQAAGFSVAEVTGRKLELQFEKKNRDTATVRNRKKENTADAFRKFQNNEIDCLFINQSGSTGASAHAVITDKVDELQVKQRVMIIAQAELNINTEVQKRGRINRTGQIYQPIYDYINSAIPAEKRLMMMMQKKLKSLDANTTSNQKQSSKILDTSDFLNKYGDKIVYEYLQENPTINTILGDPLKISGEPLSNGKATPQKDGAAHKVSGRVAVLSAKEQENFYTAILERYSDYVNYLLQAGEYDLEVETMNLEAELQEERVLIAGKGGESAFGGDTIRGKYLCNVLKKPFKKNEILAIIKDRLKGEEAEEVNKTIILVYQEYLKSKEKLELEEVEIKFKRSCEGIERNPRFEKKINKLQGGDKLRFINELIADFKEFKDENIVKIKSNIRDEFSRNSYLMKQFTAGKSFSFPILAASSSNPPKAVCLGVIVKEDDPKPYLPSNMKVAFAVSDSTKYFELNFATEQRAKLEQIHGSYIPYRSNFLADWEDIIEESDVNRKVRYILTGNILQAVGQHNGKLISFTNADGSEEKGILLPDNVDISKGGLNTTVMPISKCRKVILSLSIGSTVNTTRGISIQKNYNAYKIYTNSVSMQKYGDLVKNQDIIALCESNEGFAKIGSSWVTTIDDNNINRLIDIFDTQLSLSCELKTSVVESYGIEQEIKVISKNKKWKKLSYDPSKIPVSNHKTEKVSSSKTSNLKLLILKAKANKNKLKLRNRDAKAETTNKVCLVYAKTSGENKFGAMDINGGVYVANLIHATMLDDTDTNREKLQKLANNNKEIALILQLRSNKKVLFQTK